MQSARARSFTKLHKISLFNLSTEGKYIFYFSHTFSYVVPIKTIRVDTKQCMWLNLNHTFILWVQDLKIPTSHLQRNVSYPLFKIKLSWPDLMASWVHGSQLRLVQCIAIRKYSYTFNFLFLKIKALKTPLACLIWFPGEVLFKHLLMNISLKP